MKFNLILTLGLQILFVSHSFSQFSSVTSVTNFLAGKTFTSTAYYDQGHQYPAQTLQFKGLEAQSNNPFQYNPYSTALEFSGKPWDYPQNRFLFTITTEGEISEYCIYDLGFTQNGGVMLTFREIVRTKSKQGKFEQNPQTGLKEYVEEVMDVIKFGSSPINFYLFSLSNDGSSGQPKAGLFWQPNKFMANNTFLNY
jgi:hypothetical protein